MNLPAPPAAEPNRSRAVIGILVVIAVVAAVVVALRPWSAGPHRGHPAGRRPPAGGPEAQRAQRAAQLRAVLVAFGQGVVDHRPASARAVIDPRAPAFRAAALRRIVDARAVRLAEWSVDLGGVTAPVDATRVTAAGSLLHYRLAGFDTRPVSQPIAPVFVLRHGSWRLASLAAGRDGLPRPTELWDLEPVRSVRAPGVIVFGRAGQFATMRDLADIAAAAIPRVTAVWGGRWSRRAVLFVPDSERQFGEISGFHGPLGDIAAVTNAEIHSFGPVSPAGDRVAINPAAWGELSPVGRQIVVTHELTHVASRAATGAQTPKWLSEGLAEWISFKDSGVPVAVAAGALRRIVPSSLPRHFPVDADFHGGPSKLDLAYDEAWLAVGAIADRWGQEALIRFYRAAGTSPLPAGAAVRTAARRVLHIGEPGLVHAWRRLLVEDFG